MSTYQDLRQAHRYAAFIDFITQHSTTTACRASDRTFAKALHCSERTVGSLIAEAKDRGDIEVRTETVVIAGGFRSRRTIYLVSPEATEDGALMLATLLRDTAPTTRDTPATRDALCGQLRCTPEQLDAWLEHVLANGWFVRVKIGTDGRGWRRTGVKHERRSIPGREFVHHGKFGRLAPPPKPEFIAASELMTGEQRLLAYIAERGGNIVTSLDRIATELGFSAGKAYVSRLAARLDAQGRIQRTKEGRYVRLQLASASTSDMPVAPKPLVAPATVPTHDFVAQVAEQQPQPTPEYEAILAEVPGHAQEQTELATAMAAHAATEARYRARIIKAAKVIQATNYLLGRHPVGNLMDRIAPEREADIAAKLESMTANGFAPREAACRIVGDLVQEVILRYENVECRDEGLIQQRLAARAA